MARPATITYEDFCASVQELEAAGQKPTFAAVRLKLGGGSYDVLKRYIDRYAGESKHAGVSPGMPVNLLGGMQTWFDEAKLAARQQAYAELDEQFQALEAQSEQVRQQVVEAGQRAAAAEALARERAGRIEELLKEHAQLRELLDKADARADRLAVELGQAQAARAAETSVLAAKAEQATAQAQESQVKFLSALELAHSRFDAAQHRTMQTMDDARTAMTFNVDTALSAALRAIADQATRMAAEVASLAKEQRVSVELQAHVKELQEDLQAARQSAAQVALDGVAILAERDAFAARLARMQVDVQPGQSGKAAKAGNRTKRGGAA